jgi:hypothetical protein
VCRSRHSAGAQVPGQDAGAGEAGAAAADAVPHAHQPGAAGVHAPHLRHAAGGAPGVQGVQHRVGVRVQSPGTPSPTCCWTWAPWGVPVAAAERAAGCLHRLPVCAGASRTPVIASSEPRKLMRGAARCVGHAAHLLARASHSLQHAQSSSHGHVVRAHSTALGTCLPTARCGMHHVACTMSVAAKTG